MAGTSSSAHSYSRAEAEKKSRSCGMRPRYGDARRASRAAGFRDGTRQRHRGCVLPRDGRRRAERVGARLTMERTEAITIGGRRSVSRVLGAGPPLVLLNGYSAAASDWDPTLLGELADSFAVYAPDHRGLGESELGDPGEVSIAGMADDVRALMDAQGIGAAAVVGWSMGGFVAQRLALDTPARVSSLVLMATD